MAIRSIGQVKRLSTVSSGAPAPLISKSIDLTVWSKKGVEVNKRKVAGVGRYALQDDEAIEVMSRPHDAMVHV